MSNGRGDDEFRVEVVDEAGRPVVRVRGEIDVATAERFREAIAESLERDARLVIDMSDTSFMDSTGLSALIRAYHDTGRVKEAVQLRAVRPPVLRTLEISGISDLVTVVG
ncbi:STAS domain-containing protein [Actinomarinicola tropica]|uniref:Anti-sigma factor antagonist n=1 Tax=Actinomarinicola tropica TaxID=2789776 RepID=A0A5Q2RQW8_9ACTN|nr:STAS domain-containing protein [Actinomarinicola tropica]QGG95585.1 anti-sigma factor antagonist [Actinomarinicola tropica]